MDTLRERCRTAYERARLLCAIRALGLPIGMLFFALALDAPAAPVIAATCVLSATIATAIRSGGSAATGASIGRFAACVIVAAPLVVRLSDCCPYELCTGVCISACIVSGLCAGTWIGALRRFRGLDGLATFTATISAAASGVLGASLVEPPSLTAAGIGLCTGAVIATQLAPTTPRADR